LRDLVFDLVDYIHETKFEDIPERVIENTKIFILDTIGVAIAGSRAPGVRELRSALSGMRDTGVSTVFKFGDRLSPPAAALMNSVLIHAYDFDDTFDEGALHTYVSVLPAVFSLAEKTGNTDGKSILTALTVGVDIIVRLSLGIKTPLSWIRTATLGSFGAAAAAAKIMNFDRKKIHNTIGIVYSMTSGNAQTLIDGGLTKRMQPGFSSRAAVFSAILADHGINGAIDVFEDKFGYFNLYERGEYERDPILKDLGKEFYGTRLSIKPYPSCRMTHSSIDAVLELVNRYDIKPEDVVEVEVLVSKMAKTMVGKFKLEGNPQVEAQFSIPYTVATAILKRDVFLDDFEVENISGNRERLDFLRKIKVLEDSGIPEKEISISTVRIRTKTGVFENRVKGLKGSPQKPMTEEEIGEKVRKCLSYGGLNPEAVSDLRKILKDFENRELSELLEIVTDHGNS